MATANTMHSVVEALGMCLPGHAPVRANSPKMQANAREAARRIVEMVHEDLKPRQIMTEGAFRNAIATVLAVSGSINAIKHLQATAIEAENGLDIFTLWEEMADVPVLSAVRPTGEVRIEQFEDAGGARAVLKRLESRIDTSALTCTGKTLAENLAGYEIPGPTSSARSTTRSAPARRSRSCAAASPIPRWSASASATARGPRNSPARRGCSKARSSACRRSRTAWSSPATWSWPATRA